MTPPGFWKLGIGVDELRPAALVVQPVEHALELVDRHALAVDRDLHDVGLVGPEGRHGPGVGGGLGDDHVAGVDQGLADEVDDLLAAGRDDQSSGSTAVPSAAMTSTMQSIVTAIPSVGPYCSARAVDSAATCAISFA